MIDLWNGFGKIGITAAFLVCASVMFSARAQPQSSEVQDLDPRGVDSGIEAGFPVVNGSIVLATAGTEAGIEATLTKQAGPQEIRAAIVFRSAFEAGTGGAPPRATNAAKSWFSFDKVQHVTFGFLFTLGGQYSLVNKLDMSEKRALPLAITGSAVVGLGKELYDWRVRSRHHFSTGDLVADSLGILLAAGLILL